jgi:hypothetical protein
MSHWHRSNENRNIKNMYNYWSSCVFSFFLLGGECEKTFAIHRMCLTLYMIIRCLTLLPNFQLMTQEKKTILFSYSGKYGIALGHLVGCSQILICSFYTLAITVAQLHVPVSYPAQSSFLLPTVNLTVCFL